VAAYRPEKNAFGSTAIFECKQAISDLRRDNCSSLTTRKKLDSISQRRIVLERCLRVHYPNLRIADTLFPEFCSYDFTAIRHRSYNRVLRELNVLRNRLSNCTKFDTLTRYHCANAFYLVLPNELWDENDVPMGWGALIESGGELVVVRKPAWHNVAPENQLRLLQRIAAAATRALNRQLEITFDEVTAARRREL
jgi:hypothetical protein